MHQFYNHLLPSVFLINSLFQSKYIHAYNTRLSSKLSYSLPKARTMVNLTFLDFKVQKYGILFMESLNFSLLYNLRRK